MTVIKSALKRKGRGIGAENKNAGIFTAQFHGNADDTGVRHTFRFKVMVCALLVALWCAILIFADDPLIGLYLQGEGDPAEAAAILEYGKDYLTVMLWGFLPFALSNAYCGTLRETGQTVVPMVAGIVAVFVNLLFNYILIFGHLGAPAMGVQGAALATVISRFVELAIVAGWTHLNNKKCPFIKGAYRSMYLPGNLLGNIIRKGSPLLVNECLFAVGVAVVSQCYSTCGLDVVPAMNINNTIWNLASVSYLAMGNSVGIIMGQMLGAGISREEVTDYNRKLCVLSIVAGAVFGGICALFAGAFPMLYNTTDQVRTLASQLILISSLMIPFNAYVHAAYFTLRSGGKTGITFLFDCGAIWALMLPLAIVLTRFTDMPIIPVYILCNCVDIIKCVIGALLIRGGSWIQNLTAK